MREQGYEIVMIGHKGHPEVEGTMGQADGGMYLVETIDDVAHLHVHTPDKLAYVTQTTLSVDDAQTVVQALRTRFPLIVGPKKDDICYATQNRQDAVKALSTQTDLVLVVGSPNSSNSNRLREVAETQGIESYLIDNAGQIDPVWLQGKRSIGISAGASAPEVLVKEVVAKLHSLGVATVSEFDGIAENVVFSLPKGLA